jgi:hypothetical protein
MLEIVESRLICKFAIALSFAKPYEFISRDFVMNVAHSISGIA